MKLSCQKENGRGGLPREVSMKRRKLRPILEGGGKKAAKKEKRGGERAESAFL